MIQHKLWREGLHLRNTETWHDYEINVQSFVSLAG